MPLKILNNIQKNCIKNVYIKKTVVIFFLTLGIFFLFSCFKNADKPTVFVPKNNVLPSYDKYLVIQKPHVRIYSKKNITTDVLYIVRKGDVVEVEKSGGIDEDGFFWYQITVNLDKVVLNEEKNIERDIDDQKSIRGWVLLFSPIRTDSREKANFISRTVLEKQNK